MDFKKILIAVDASENAMRAVDYTGNILSCLACAAPDAVRDFLVTLLYVERLPDRDIFPDETAWIDECEAHSEKMKAFLERARRRMTDADLPEEIVETRYLVSCRSPLIEGAQQCSKGASIAQEILNVLKQEEYGTAVVGRRGVSKAEEFLFGSVSSKIIHSAKDCTVWVVA